MARTGWHTETALTTGETCVSPPGPPKLEAQTKDKMAAMKKHCGHLSKRGLQDANPGRTFDVQRGEYRGGDVGAGRDFDNKPAVFGDVDH